MRRAQTQDCSSPTTATRTTASDPCGPRPVTALPTNVSAAARAETHEVVLVNVDDGTETVIEPPEADGPGENVRWYPFSVSWSPDGTTLLYSAWRSGVPVDEVDSRSHLITVRADAPHDVTVLSLVLGIANGNPAQMWGRQPE